LTVFFGGAFSFVGGVRVLSSLFSSQFTFYMGLFLSSGMLGCFVSQYPLLVAVNHFGTNGAMMVVALFGLIVIIFNFLYLHPIENSAPSDLDHEKFSATFWQIISLFLSNYRNWLDCIMVILLDTPVSIIGTLWGLVILMNCYHISDIISSWIVMALFVGLMIGSPLWGAISDRYRYAEWIIVVGSGFSFLTILPMLFFPHLGIFTLASLFFGLGLFSSCQTLGFTWLTKNMRPELIGRQSAFNSMLFMVTSGGFKQLGAYLLLTTSILWHSSAMNLLLLIASCMLITTCYAFFRTAIFYSINYAK
jgi:predicted MFS family arabinose efflux permease